MLDIMSKLLIKISFILYISSFLLGTNSYAQVIDNLPEQVYLNDLDTINLNIKKKNDGFFIKKINQFISKRKSGDAFVEDREDDFLNYEDKKIRNIYIKILKPFGPIISDTSLITEKWLEKTANILHNSTKERYVRRLISFKEGVKVNAWELADNERFLRSRPIFHDVDISIKEVDENTVDIIIICEDVFSMAFEINTDFKDKFNLSIFHKNLFGFDNQLVWDISYDKKNIDMWDYSFIYSIKNISHSYIDMSLGLKKTNIGDGFSFKVQRDFKLSSTKWAGLLGIEGVNGANVMPYERKKDFQTSFDYLYFDSWLGYSHNTFNNSKRINNLMIATAYKSIVVKNAPTEIDLFPYYMTKHRYLSSFNYSKRQYFKTNYIYDLGRTEDISKGFLLNLTLGYETNDESNLAYSGFQLAKAWFFKRNMEYIAARLSYGAFYNENKIERGVIEFKTQSISKLFKLDRCLLRFNSSLSYMTGFNRYPDDFVYFNDYVRGLNSKSIRGNQKLSFNFTQNLFVPYIINGFRCSVFTFADIGWIGDNNKAIYKADDYYGLGLGFKFNNDNLIFRTFSIRFAFYPKVPNDYRQFETIIRSSGSGEFINLNPQRPEIIEYE